METEKSRSESPFSRSKTKSHLSDASEIGNDVTEQIKIKKKCLRNKSKSQANGKENEEVASNVKDFFEEEKPTQNKTDKYFDTNNTDHENGIENYNSPENNKENEGASKQEVTDDKENNALISICEIPEEKIICESRITTAENNIVEENKSTENVITVNIEENCTEQYSKLETTETESRVKENSSEPSVSMPEYEAALENFEEICNENENDNENDNDKENDNDNENENDNENGIDISNNVVNVTVKELETSENCSEIKESSQASINGSDVTSHSEEASTIEDHSQASAATVSKDDLSVSIKITSFLKWEYSQDQKQNSEVSSSKKIDNTILNQFDLSKVSGRRGIKDRLNSSAAVFSSKEMEAKTPESSQISLDDSFRVRTNPPRLNSLNLKENPTLRKFKGKRCLNAEDEPEEEDDMYFNTLKKRKLDEKTKDSGLLGSILWSPFKKKSYDDKNQIKLATAESRLSRLLSPFWFWKKTGTEQNNK